MIINSNGARYTDYALWEDERNKPYDYANKGVLNKILSSKIYNTKNIILKQILNIYETSLVMVMKYADELQNCFNYNWKNR